MGVKMVVWGERMQDAGTSGETIHRRQAHRHGRKTTEMSPAVTETYLWPARQADVKQARSRHTMIQASSQ